MRKSLVENSRLWVTGSLSFDPSPPMSKPLVSLSGLVSCCVSSLGFGLRGVALTSLMAVALHQSHIGTLLIERTSRDGPNIRTGSPRRNLLANRL